MSNLFLKSELIRAGAGTGKTYRLIQKVSQLYKDSLALNNKPPRLVICTFTRKASQELKERLFNTAIEMIETYQGDLKKAPEFLNYLQSPFLQISTIDGVLNKFLKKYGQAIDLSPDFQISYDSFDDTLFDTLADTYIYEKHFSLLKELRYSYLKEILLFYFKCRIKYGKLTFYNEEDFKEFQNEREILIDNKKKFVKEEEFQKYLKANPQSLLSKVDYKSVKKLITEEKSFLKEPFTDIFKKFQPVAEEFFLEFIDKKKNSALLQIEDLLLFSCYLLNTKPNIAKKYCEEWDYWLIDEYQDTSFLQEQVIEKITAFKNVFCVGDLGQSIYSFRKADPKVFIRRENTIKEQGGNVEYLTVNYRSSPALIAFYNEFFLDSQFMRFKASDAHTDNEKKCVTFLTYNLEIKSQQTVELCSTLNPAIRLPKDKNEKDKNALVALSNYISCLKNKGVNYNQITILSSRNEDLMKIATHLRKESLPLRLYSSKKFSNKRLILDSLFLLKFLINPYDDVNLKALLRTPYFKLSDQDLASSSHGHNYQEAKESFWSFVKKTHQNLWFIKSLESYLLACQNVGLFESFKQALFDSGIMDLSYLQDPTSSSTSNLWKLLNILNKKDMSALNLFYKLMEENEDERFKETPTSDDNQAIQLMTIHKSKGLEFEHVIVLDFAINKSSLKSQESPIAYDEIKNKMTFAVPILGVYNTKVKSYGHKVYDEINKKEHLLERDRLFYVAMTRAKKSLTVFIPQIQYPEKNSWLSRVNYFKGIDKLLVSKKEDKIWYFKEGEYDNKNYILTVSSCETLHDQINSAQIVKKEKIESSSSLIKLDTTLFLKKDKVDLVKSSKDFIFYIKNQPLKNSDKNTSENSMPLKNFVESNIENTFWESNSHELKTQKFKSRSQIKNTLLKAQLGNELHYFMQKLSYLPVSKLQDLIKIRDKNLQTQIHQAINYVLNLKDPHLSLFIEKGFSEWSFKFKKQNVILQGQIDLWYCYDSTIHVVDYKSSSFADTQKQLIFYSWVLNEMQPNNKIFMYECCPLQKQTTKTFFSLEHKNQIETWLNTCL